MSTQQLVQQRKAKASAASAWAALKASDGDVVETVDAPGSGPVKARKRKGAKARKAGQARKAPGTQKAKKAAGAAGKASDDSQDAGAGGGAAPADGSAKKKAKKKKGGNKRPRDAAAILRQLNKGPTKRKAQSAKVGGVFG